VIESHLSETKAHLEDGGLRKNRAVNVVIAAPSHPKWWLIDNCALRVRSPESQRCLNEIVIVNEYRGALTYTVTKTKGYLLHGLPLISESASTPQQGEQNFLL